MHRNRVRLHPIHRNTIRLLNESTALHGSDPYNARTGRDERKLLGYAIDHEVYVKTRLPHSALICSPFKALTGTKPTLKHVHVFGCASFLYNENPEPKAHTRAVPGIFFGM